MDTLPQLRMKTSTNTYGPKLSRPGVTNGAMREQANDPFGLEELTKRKRADGSGVMEVPGISPSGHHGHIINQTVSTKLRTVSSFTTNGHKMDGMIDTVMFGSILSAANQSVQTLTKMQKQ